MEALVQRKIDRFAQDLLIQASTGDTALAGAASTLGLEKPLTADSLLVAELDDIANSISAALVRAAKRQATDSWKLSQ